MTNSCSLTEHIQLPRPARHATLETIGSRAKLAGAAGPDFLEALARGLRVIEAFGRDRRWLTLSDVARLVDLPRASVRRTLTPWSRSVTPRRTIAYFA